MITVVFKNIFTEKEVDLEKTGNIYIEFNGHSGLNTKGNDIICSAVSILVHTFTLSVGKILKIRQRIVRKDGFLSTDIMMDEVSFADRSRLKLLIESLIIGLTAIDDEYPEKIKIKLVND